MRHGENTVNFVSEERPAGLVTEIWNLQEVEFL